MVPSLLPFGLSGRSASRVVRIVLVSPSDVQEERNLVCELANQINAEYREKRALGLFDCVLEVRGWERDARPGTDPHGEQGLIDRALRTWEADLVIGIFWKRFGTPTLDGKTGTEHEFVIAHQNWTQHGRPDMMFYFRQSAYTPQSEKEAQQWASVLRFKERLQKEFHVFTWDYMDLMDFQKQVGHHLRLFVLNLLGASLSIEPPILKCRVDAQHRPLRQHGLTELAGDIAITCTSVGDNRVDDHFDIRVFVVSTVSNRLLDPGSYRSSGFVTDSVATSDCGGPPVYGALLETLVRSPTNRYGLLFHSVRICTGDVHAQKTVLIRNIRVVAPDLLPDRTGPVEPPMVCCYVDVRRTASSAPQSVEDSSGVVGTVRIAVKFHVWGPNGVCDQPIMFSDAPNGRSCRRVEFVVSFEEGFPGAFRTVAGERAYDPDSGIGFAHRGTMFRVSFGNVPEGLRVSVTRTNVRYRSRAGDDSLSAVLADRALDCRNEVRAPGDDYVSLTDASAIWECTSPSDGTEPEEVYFGVRVESSPGWDEPPALQGSTGMTVSGLLWPASTVQQASSSDPVPRFRLAHEQPVEVWFTTKHL